MKSDLDDSQICKMLFGNLTFTDKLIEQHLQLPNEFGNVNEDMGRAKFVARDAESYRNFLNTSGARGVVSPYDHFFMKESTRKGNPEEIAQQIFDLQNEHPQRP